MRKTYMMLLALVFSVLGTTAASAQKIYQAELDKSMFKAWNGTDANAEAVEPTSYVGKGDATVEFACETNFYKKLDAGAVVFGNTNVYSRWYADLTGTTKMYFTGDPDTRVRVLMNRPDAEPGAEDPNGGTSVEKQVTIGSDGTGELDVTDLEYVHLNCVKIAWGSSGVIKTIILEGTVKPVTGILSMINNGDAEGEDLSSFPVSLDGPNNGDSAPDSPQIVEGGVDGSKCFKVTAFDSPTETWHTQFYIKSDEVLPKGTKWMLKMSIKADQATTITTSAQAQPRAWKGGFIDEFGVSEEWNNFKWSGEIGVDDFQSIAFDLSNENGNPGNAGVSFYFDNIEFGVDLGGSNPMNDIAITAGADVVCVNFNGNTNIAELVKNYGVNTDAGRTVIFDNSSAKVSINGEEMPILSVEGRENGNLYFFLEDGSVDNDEDVVKVAFTNPSNEERRLLFTNGKWEGQPVPDFSGIDAAFDEKLGEGEIYSYMWGAPALEKITPEAGSFNLPATVNSFTVTFNQDVVANTLVAKLGAESLTVSPAEGESKEFTLTRTAATEIKGAVELTISAAAGVKGNDLNEPIVVKFSYGPVATEGDAQPETIYQSNFSGEGDNANGAGWYVNAGEALQPANSGSGCRIMHSQGAFAEDLVYIAQRDAANGGVAVYGIDEENKLALEAGKTYHVTLKACRHDRTDVALRVQVLPEEAVSADDGSVVDPEAILAEDFKAITPEKTSKQAVSFDLAVTPEEAGNFVIRLVPSKENGSFAGYDDPVCFGDVKVEFIPDVMGIVETKALNDALEAAQNAYNDIVLADEERYAGDAMTDLNNLITEVSENKATYTAPSVYVAKAAELEAKTKAANDHKAACDTYDENIKKAIDMVLAHADDKFNQTQTYTDLKAITDLYHATGEKVNIGSDEEPIYETQYQFDQLKDDASLTNANKDLTAAVNLGNNIFTSVALDADIQEGNCGIAVLVERNRLGARTLKSLGVADDDPLIQRAQNAITDDDDLAENIKLRIKSILYDDLAKGKESTLFVPSEDDFDGEGNPVIPSYDMTVFAKNPNIYCLDGQAGVSPQNVPGWDFVLGGNPGLFRGWGERGVAGLPEDGAFTTWFGTNRMEQTITDLPAGMYVVSLCGSDWSNQAGNADNPHDVNGFVYCKTSNTPAVEEGEEEDREINFAATRTIVFGGQYNMNHALNLGVEEVIDEATGFVSTSQEGEVMGISVTDGKLTFGIHFAGDAQYFFQHVKITLIAPADGFDYETEKTGIEAAAAAPTVRALQVYDLNGRRMIKANKGLQIVKKQMSDGTVRVEKVIVK